VSNDALLQSARQAIQAGQKQQARDLLQQAIRQNPGDHRPWLWLAGITPSARASLDYVNRAVVLRPNDPVVQKAQAWAERRWRQEQSQVVSQTAAATTAATPVSPPIARSEAVTMPLPAALPVQPKPVTERSARAMPRPTSAPRARRDWGIATVAAIGFFSLLAFLIAGLAWWQTMGPGQAIANDALSNELPRPHKQAAVYGSLELPLSATPTATPDPLQPKAAVAEGQARATWTTTPSPTPSLTPTPVPTETPTPYPTIVGEAPVEPWGLRPGEKWIDVNLTTQTLNAYEGSQHVFTSLVSSGTWQHATVTGQFRVYLRYEAQTMNGYLLGYDYFLEDVPYVMYFYEDYALHGTYWHNNFGTPMSHGCVNLPTPNAEWIYNWSTIGTLVNVHY
jgi:lipoprotein-anchoring transpeptidase ErfK/SrfK